MFKRRTETYLGCFWVTDRRSKSIIKRLRRYVTCKLLQREWNIALARHDPEPDAPRETFFKDFQSHDPRQFFQFLLISVASRLQPPRSHPKNQDDFAANEHKRIRAALPSQSQRQPAGREHGNICGLARTKPQNPYADCRTLVLSVRRGGINR